MLFGGGAAGANGTGSFGRDAFSPVNTIGGGFKISYQDLASWMMRIEASYTSPLPKAKRTIAIVDTTGCVLPSVLWRVFISLQVLVIFLTTCPLIV